MKKYLLIIISLFILCFTNAFSQIPLPQKTVAVEVAFPNPIDLDKNWWEYFNVKEDEFNVRKEKFANALIKIKKDLNAQQLTVIEPLIDRILVGLEVLSEFKKPVIPAPPSKEEIKASYNFQDLINLGLKRYEIDKSKRLYEFQISLERKTLKLSEKKLDLLTQEYFEIKQKSFDKLLKGLELIFAKISIEIDKFRLLQMSNAIEEKNVIIKLNEKQIDIVRNGLVYSQDSLTKMQEERSSLDQTLKQIQVNISKLDIEINLLSHKREILNSQTDRLLVKLLQESIKETTTELKIIKNEVITYFLILGLKKEKIKTANIYKQITLWSKKLEQLKADILNLQKQLDIYLDKYLYKAQKEKEAAFVNEFKSISQNILLEFDAIGQEFYITNFLIDQITLETKEKYTGFLDQIYAWGTSAKLFLKKYVHWFHESLFKIGYKSITPWDIIKFILIIIVTYFLAKTIRFFIRAFGIKQHRISQYAIYTLSRLTFYIVIFFGLVIAILSIGVDLRAFAFFAGVLGIGLGLGLQSVFNNFVAGILLLLEKNVRVGDFIELESKEIGTIKEINVRTTLMRTLDNLEILIPNSDLISKKFTNWTLSEKIRRVRIPFSVAYGADKNKVKEIVVDAAKKVAITLPTKEPDVWLIEFGESSLNFELIVWVDEYMSNVPIAATKARYLWEIETVLKENNIKIPFPQRDIHIIENNEIPKTIETKAESK